MFKFLKKMTKKLAWSTFEIWKDRKIAKAKEAVAVTLEDSVDKATKGLQMGVFGTIAIAGCAAGAFVLLPLAFCMESMAAGLSTPDVEALADSLSEGAATLYVVGYVMAGVLTVVVLGTILWSQSKKKQLKSRINDALRD